MSSIQNISMRDYQAAPGVNKSLLDQFARCPALAKRHLDGTRREQSEAMQFGSLVDASVFSPLLSGPAWIVQPETYKNDDGEILKWNGNAKHCREWVRLASEDGLPVIKRQMNDEIHAASNAVLNHPHAALLLSEGHAQASLFATCPRTGLPLKGRPDWLGNGQIVDLKTTADASPDAIARQIATYRYHVQAAFYLDLAKLCGVDCSEFYFIFVERGAKPLVNVRRLNDRAIELGRYLYRRDLEGFAKCQASGIWPDYSGAEAIQEIDVPAWAHCNAMDGMELVGAQEIIDG